MRILTFLLIILGFSAFTAPAKAQLSDADQKDVAAAQDYLQNLGSARARFVQTAHDGSQFVGTFYLKRPGRLRFDYDPPVEDFVVADGLFIYFYDADLQEQTNAPIGATLADFLLRKDLKLTNDDISVKNVKRDGDLLQIEMVQTDDPESGSLSLAFTTDPFVLKKWRVVDAQDLITEVELFYLKTDITHPSGLFSYINPKHGQENYNE